MNLSSVELLLVAGRAVFLIFSFVIAAIAFTAWRRAMRVQTDQILAQTNMVLQRLAALEARVDATKASVSQLGERVDRPLQVAPAPTAPGAGYQIAIRLAKGGASREELMAGCGLSLSEAELVQRLHGQPSSHAGENHAFRQPPDSATASFPLKRLQASFSQ